MDSPTIFRTFKCHTSQHPIFSVTEPPLQCRSFPPDLDISFSSYLKYEEPAPGLNDDAEINVFEAHKYFSEGTNRKENKTAPFANHEHGESQEFKTAPRLSSASSIDGYGFHRNCRPTSFHATPTASSEASWNSQKGLLSNPPGSVAVSLKNIPSHYLKKKSSAVSKWTFCRRCPCSGKKSVQVDEASSANRAAAVKVGNINANTDGYKTEQRLKTSEIIAEKGSSIPLDSLLSPNVLLERPQRVAPNTSSLILSERCLASSIPGQRVSMSGRALVDGEAGFSFPVLSPSYPTKPALKNLSMPRKCTSPPFDPGRHSLEVFQPLSKSISRKSIDIMPRAPASSPGCRIIASRGKPYLGSSSIGVTPAEDDIESDASSDLFEIESFSTQTTTAYPIGPRRDSLDDIPKFSGRHILVSNGTGNSYSRRSLDEPETPSIAPTECYAPSEVSIDWSVTTAEGFDRASINSYSIAASGIYNSAARSRHGGGNEGNEGGRKKGNGLLSCRHEKAVSVGPHPIKFVHKK